MSIKKIAVISFDHWNYDRHIVAELKKKGVQAVHINIGQYKHANIWVKTKNTLSKIFFDENPKKVKRQEFILETLKKLGIQDQILVINPELIDKKYHLEIKKYTSRYIAYLYDSVARCPVEHLLEDVFDTIFSFDTADVKKYGFQETTNYIYLEKQKITETKSTFDVFYLASFDKRMDFLKQISNKLDGIQVSYLFIIVGKKTWKKQLFAVFGKTNKNIIYRRKRINQENLGDYYAKSNAIFDLVRDHQTGLSFRVFEAMAYQKKLITNNPNIMNYDFYNSNNIMVINEKKLEFDPAFFSSNYEPLADKIYNKYTLEHWTKTVFDL